MRKVLLLRILLLCALCRQGDAFAKEWAFEVWLDKQNIGSHTFTLNQDQLKSQASFKVKVLFINAYRYQHEAEERWQGGCLAQLSAHTVENKEVTEVSGHLQNGQFLTLKNGHAHSLPACVMTFAYWNPDILKQSRLLNPQNAEYLDISVTDQGQTIMQVKGQPTPAQQYLLLGKMAGKEKLRITLWYDQAKEWIGLESITPEGYKIIYKLM